MSASWTRFLIAGLVLYSLGLIGGPDAMGLAWQIIGWSTVVALIRLGKRLGDAQSVPWYWLAAGAGAILVGGVAQTIQIAIAGEDGYLVPSAGEPFYIFGYIAIFVSEIKLIRLRTVVRYRADLVDALIVGAAAGLLVWVTILGPFIRDDSISIVERGFALQYSVLTLLIVVATTRLAVGPGLRSPSYYLFAAAIGLVFFTDVVLTLQTTGALDRDLYGTLSPLAYLLGGAAILHPSIVRLTERPEYTTPRLTWRRIVMLSTALLIGPAVFVIQDIRGVEIDLPIVVTGWAMLSLLVMARLGSLLREEEGAANRERVLRDMGSVLVVGGSREEMHSAALWAVLELTDGLPAGRASVLSIDEGVAKVVATVGRRSAGADGVSVALDALPREVQEALHQRHAISLEQVPAFDVLDPASHEIEASVVVAPLVARGRTTGAIVVASSIPIERGVVSALTSVAMEVSLAIESAALTEDLHRRKSDRRFRSLVENGSEFIVVLDDEGFGIFATPVVERLLGHPEHYFLGPLPQELIHPQDENKFAALLAVARSGSTDDDPIELRLLHADSTYRWFEMRARDLSDEPEVGGLVLTARDVTDRKLAEQRLARSEARFRSLVQNSSDVVAVIDETGSVTYVSPAVAPMLGYRAEELVGTNVMRLLPADEVSRAMRLLESLGQETFEQLNIEMRLRDRDGAWRNVDVTISDMRSETAVQGIVLNVRDVTVRRALEEDLQHKALHDELTGLGNRTYFQQRVAQALNRSDSRLDQVAVLFVDLDDFKEVNDSLGHRLGDQLLMSVAERIRACLRVSDTAARLGGDEFGVLLEDTYGESEVFAVADRILLAISQPFTIDGRELAMSASIGIVIDIDRSATAEGLLRSADVALYLAKNGGKARYELFQEAAHASAFERLELKAALGEAIRKGGLVLHYQPIVALDTGAIVGCEALVRWEHPERGLMPPNDFIPLAEDSGLIVGLGRWVLNEACDQMARWAEVMPESNSLRVSVNLSVRQIESMSLMTDVSDALEHAGVSPDRLTLEITESLVMNDDADTLDRMTKLRSRGIMLAVDDFGTGYSSLGYIQQFPLDTIKIDRSFVNRLGVSKGGTGQLVRTIIDLAESLHATTVAEGIETAEELDALVAMGCTHGQGFYFARPIPADQFLALLRSWGSGSEILARSERTDS